MRWNFLAIVPAGSLFVCCVRRREFDESPECRLRVFRNDGSRD